MYFAANQASRLRSLLTLAVLMCVALLTVAASEPAHAQNQNKDRVSNFNTTFSRYEYNPCAGEYVSIEGELHGQSKMTYNKKTGTYTEEFQINARGTAVGAESGTRYVFNEIYRATFNFDTWDYVVVDRMRLISPGPEHNDFLVLTFRSGFDENGDRYVEEDIAFECRG